MSPSVSFRNSRRLKGHAWATCPFWVLSGFPRARQGGTPMRHRHLITMAIAVWSASGVVIPAIAGEPGPDSDLVDRYTQVVYELKKPSGSPVVNVRENVVNAMGQVISRSTYEKAVPDRRALAATEAA